MRLQTLASTPSSRRLLDHLRNPGAALLPADPTGHDADLQPVIDRSIGIVTSLHPGEWDAALAVELHPVLEPFPRRLLANLAFWHWMTTGPFRQFVVARWLATDPAMVGELAPAEVGRFLGSGSLNGASRNALARLFWGADALHDTERGYDLAMVVLGNQDFYQQIFERKLGLHPPAAKAMAEGLRDSSERERRDAAVRLNFLFSTIVAEQLDEADVLALLRS